MRTRDAQPRPSRSGRRGHSRFEEEVDVVAEEVLDLVGELPVVFEAGIGFEDHLRGLAGFDDDRFVTRDAAELEIAEAGLTLTEHLTGATDLKLGRIPRDE